MMISRGSSVALVDVRHPKPGANCPDAAAVAMPGVYVMEAGARCRPRRAAPIRSGGSSRPITSPPKVITAASSAAWVSLRCSCSPSARSSAPASSSSSGGDPEGRAGGDPLLRAGRHHLRAFSALAYAELAGSIPVSASSYSYTYATLGELLAWIVGWMLDVGVRGLGGGGGGRLGAVPQ